MSNRTEDDLTAAVLARLEGVSDARFRQIMSSLIRHLHAFVRETELTDAEWFEGIRFLTATGKKCDEKRQEYILLSDTLGASANGTPRPLLPDCGATNWWRPG